MASVNTKDSLETAIEPLTNLHAYDDGGAYFLPRYFVEDADDSVRYILHQTDILYTMAAVDIQDNLLAYVLFGTNSSAFIVPPEYKDDLDSWVTVTWAEAICHMADLAVAIARDKSLANLAHVEASARETKSRPISV